MKSKYFLDNLDKLFPNPKCELDYNKDYELLIATILSAQSTDKRVNLVTKELFAKYDVFSLATANKKDIENIIRSIGTYTKKSGYIIGVAKSLVTNYEGIVPNNRAYLESLPGVGRKTANVVLSNLFAVPAIAVDTHVSRVSKRLNLANEFDSVEIIEQKLMDFLPKSSWSKAHHQLVLFGRYICKSRSPECQNCLFKNKCQYYLCYNQNRRKI